MAEIGYFLIPTADKTTWMFDRPVVFLGKWCLRYEDRGIWNAMVYELNATPNNDQNSRDNDANIAINTYKKLFPKLCAILNEHHQVNHSQRYWEILLGSWFDHYIKMMFNRVKTLQKCLENYQISSIANIENINFSLASKDSNSAAFACDRDDWNHVLTLRILDFMSDIGIQKIRMPNQVLVSNVNFSSSKADTKLKAKRKLLSLFKLFARIFRRRGDALIISTYLSLKSELLLQLFLGQFPQFYSSSNLKIESKIDLQVRGNLGKLMRIEKQDLYQEIISSLLFEIIPICYLEGFIELGEIARKKAFPVQPKFIFTSNSFEYDEPFKIWAAAKSQSGCKLIYGQHGNTYGTGRFMKPSMEEKTCDHFITWGWSDGTPKYLPGFMFRDSGKTIPSVDKLGGLLLIETEEPIRFETWDTTSDYYEYLEAQREFVETLNFNPRSQLNIRLTSGSHLKNNSELQQWNEFGDVNIDLGFLPIKKLIPKSRLLVHSYDSTGILETLSWNLPTIAFWRDGFEHLRDEVISDYELLLEVGIIHLSPVGAARKVNEVWGNIDSWWQDKAVQDARSLFCEKYARTSKSPISDLRRILLEGQKAKS